ncbi:TatD family deoxyribonuclease [Bacillus sp. HMF5848]|uniref:TatD family hydrolase n=1 Tax=Bacillus sp. HMF5848 TaxID=2495421 RepID=UPI000F79020C|nr:TatD family hydrolase [Bacillus sp. HMF5848]RSK25995.1 TatD family deoxyribonuclease [Bacillus sp. HMF5848]
MKIIDAHVHLDKYEEHDAVKFLQYCDLEAAVSVSFDYASCLKTETLAHRFSKVKPVYGFHPEQEPLKDNELETMMTWIRTRSKNMVAVGEVGLPYYLAQIQTIDLSRYVEILEAFIKLAKELDKPIVLHAVYEHAPIVCDLLEKYSLQSAHFHWFKGDSKTIERMSKNGYYISFTPDIIYEPEIQQLAKVYPLMQVMLETDGPWAFEGPFSGKTTQPWMIHESVNILAEIKRIEVEDAYNQIVNNTKYFFNL